jgi:periplasmic divalent cation tolerance protein
MLERKLVACVNIIPQVKSMYWWQGKIESSSELILMCKTSSALLGELTTYVKGAHPYEVSEVISASLGEGNPDYYSWLLSSVKKPGEDQQ